VNPTPPRDWDAATYDLVANPMTAWGTAVLDRLPLRGDERVMDAGCGSGRVTELLAERLPQGSVVAVDGSPAMIDQARARLARFGDRIEYVVADLGRAIPAARPVDAVLRPGGRLTAQCGGAGNIASIQRVLAGIGDGWLGPVHFETPEATTDRLAAAGFIDIRCWLTEEPTRFEPGEPFEAYLRTVVLGAHLERLTPPERDPFVHEIASRLGEAAIDYVRLNIDAVRGG
jgi:trans-aconitate 2-methyltransferase